MKIGCTCGATITDTGERLPTKAHVISDVDWLSLLDSIDEAIEEPSSADKDAACRRVRGLMRRLTRLAWQCAACGVLFVDNAEAELQRFVPGDEGVDRRLFRGAPSNQDPTQR
ncbi:MAG: hypothetical protein MUC96_05685 [Myxococcaceae bacterium]|jgi:hypothetical protein|nr:hypothetical protein [Myxococcaceae bacterium]